MHLQETQPRCTSVTNKTPVALGPSGRTVGVCLIVLGTLRNVPRGNMHKLVKGARGGRDASEVPGSGGDRTRFEASAKWKGNTVAPAWVGTQNQIH